MILLWGRPRDPPIAAIARELLCLNAPTLVLDTQDVERVDLDPSTPCPGAGQLVLRGGHRVELGAVGGAYLRPHHASADTESLRITETLLAWAEMTTAVIVNRPAASGSNHSKPYQGRLIGQMGFAVPDTLLTTDRDAALEFWTEHGEVIYKSISGVRSIVGRLSPSDHERMADLASCPVQFQRYVEGTDHRVHVIGDNVFACRVRSTAIDYRYTSVADPPIELQPAELPVDVARRCVSLTASLGIDFAGIDLRVDAEGCWWCFEVNTAPGFTWYEAQTQQPIGAAVALHLTCEDRPKAASQKPRPPL